ncbi:MAG TPA: YbdK family carboxylate-amine ligase [Arachnia sp.]|mgnify:CR=1 FL=1|nr:YbdK family carboxylate-amine ligase [Arachnia sp.]HMT86587.1 YbdK family carboxylate-amine ligase [Arachnia sp.]
MKIQFADSAQSTIGIEWELAVVDKTTLEQVPGAAIVLESVEDPVDGPIRGEYLNSMIELVTGVHTTVAGATDELGRLLDHVTEKLDPHGLALMGAGCHPFGDPTAQKPVDKPQYRRVTERAAWWGAQMAINGLHIHCGISHRDKALPITYGLARFGPYFIALSGSSPFWQGKDTKFASQRTMIFQQLPTNGLPYHFRTWEEYERFAGELESVGMIQNQSEIRWDVRPSSWGTVENRAMDSVPTLFEVGALAALSQALTERMHRAIDAGEPIDRLNHWFLRENKWRAARYGLAADVIVPRPDEFMIHTTDGILRWTEELSPIADELGCGTELRGVQELVKKGPSYLRQRRVYAGSDGDILAVARSLVDETAARTPRFKES